MGNKNRPIWHIFLILCALVIFTNGCRTPGPIVKVFQSRPDLGGIARNKGTEIVTYPQTSGWFCMDPVDFEALLNYCLNPPDKPTAAQLLQKEFQKYEAKFP